jgi:hypothetical protein
MATLYPADRLPNVFTLSELASNRHYLKRVQHASSSGTQCKVNKCKWTFKTEFKCGFQSRCKRIGRQSVLCFETEWPRTKNSDHCVSAYLMMFYFSKTKNFIYMYVICMYCCKIRSLDLIKQTYIKDMQTVIAVHTAATCFDFYRAPKQVSVFVTKILRKRKFS